MEPAHLWLIAALYLLPTLYAWLNRHPHTLAVCIVNVFLGWTLLFWVLALAWAFVLPNRQRAT